MNASHPNARSTSVLAALALLSLSLGACSAFMPKPPPAWEGPDEVDAVDADVFVGDWRLVALNAPEDEEVPERRLSYAADGTFDGEIQPTADMIELTGGEPILMSGTWGVDDGALVHLSSEVSMPGDNMVSRLASSMLKSRPPIAARAEIYEVGVDRIVVVSEQGYANALERL